MWFAPRFWLAAVGLLGCAEGLETEDFIPRAPLPPRSVCEAGACPRRFAVAVAVVTDGDGEPAFGLEQFLPILERQAGEVGDPPTLNEVWQPCDVRFLPAPSGSTPLDPDVPYFEGPVDVLDVDPYCVIDGESRANNDCFTFWKNRAAQIGDCEPDEKALPWGYRCRAIPVFVAPRSFFPPGIRGGVFIRSQSPPLIFLQPDEIHTWAHELAHVLLGGGHVDSCDSGAPFCASPRPEERNVLCRHGGYGFGRVPMPDKFEEGPCATVQQCSRVDEHGLSLFVPFITPE